MRHRVILLERLIGPVEGAPKQAPCNSIPVHQDTIILVVARKRSHRQNDIVTIAHLPVRQIVIVQGTHKRRLAIAENMHLIVEAVLERRRIDGQTLLRLRTRQLVTRRLIMIRIRNHTRQQSHNGAGMNLQMGGVWLYIFREVRHKRLIHFVWVDIFDDTRVRRETLNIGFEGGCSLAGKRVHESALKEAAPRRLREHTHHEAAPRIPLSQSIHGHGSTRP